MTDFMDCELIKARDPETGETVEAIRVPEGFVLCLVDEKTAARWRDWQECVAFRLVTADDGTVGALEVTDDMDWVTSPEAEK